MKTNRYLLPLALLAGWFLPGLTAAEPATVSTLDIAGRVLRKGIPIVDLTKYPGILLLHGMTEMALVHPTRRDELLRENIDWYAKYGTKEIKGRGSFICYQAGGSGPAMLHWMKLADRLGPQVEDAARRMMEQQQRSTEGLLIPTWAKDYQVFIDIAFAVSPYLLYAGMAFDRPEYVDMAVRETVELFRILRDEKTGLVHQGRGFNGVGSISEDNWSEGSGWGAFALALLVRDLPAKHPRRPEVEALAKSFFTAVLAHQNPNGLWHQEMTDDTSYVETSGCGLLLYGLGIMIEKGYLDAKYKSAIARGIRSYQAYIDRDGSVSHTCKACLCPGKGTKEDYKRYEWVFNDPHAFGPVVLAFAQAHRIGIERVEPLVEGAPLPAGGVQPERPRAYVRMVAERKEDLAWENDRIGFRVFGPPAKDVISSGIDIWAKSVDYPVLEKWYRQNRNGKSYHQDWGEGGDVYANGYGRGCGGLAVWAGDKPYISQTYAKQQILKNDVDEVVFELTYDPWSAGGVEVSERRVISLKKGSNLFRATSTFQAPAGRELVVGIGLTTFGKPELTSDAKTGLLWCWEKVDPKYGHMGTAVRVDPAQIVGFKSFEKDSYVLIRMQAGQPFAYQAGACWDGNAQFRTKADWQRYLEAAVKEVR